MTIFNYKLINNDGLTQKGKIDALNKDEAVKLIKDKDSYIIEIEDNKNKFMNPFDKTKKFSFFEKVNFTDHLAALIRAGTPIRDALEAYMDEGSEGSEMISSIIRDVERGQKLSDSFAKYPNTFSGLYIAFLKAGETAGNLDETLEYLANELRREYEFKQKVKSALFYPCLVLGVAALVISFIVIFLVPKIINISQNLGQNVPKITRLIISATSFLSRNSLFFVLLIIILGLTTFITLTNQNIKNKISVKLLKFPLTGKIIKKYILARLLRIVASCIKYGIPLTVAFETAKDVVGNIKYRQSCIRIIEKIQKGVSLSAAFSSEGPELFPNIITRSVKGSEKSGGVEKSLDRLSIQYEIEIERDMKKLIDLMEPVLVVVLGIIVLGIALAVVTPIYQLTTNYM
ncbi:hypothetical protein A2159_01200 [Candidatus Woesebacteria bacterium RBG_13_34_9]|uniref:Type II secretion system protein GspF domain-containing protein n=1 Tax=Candidatus Woesebacteria bacterium RBG_13_34_9 TaxID=1802477 RepID=A0A1F7X269_9BACT|nr:MAG: hypothetical protein A2159_01200 [Candidatus Woesebacteria bacterium RBG_13_34_9]